MPKLALDSWKVTPSEAKALQNEYASLVCREGRICSPESVAGVDVAISRDRRRALGAVAVLSYPGLEVSEVRIVEQEAVFPYIPGLLSFREAPVVLEAFERLSRQPDLVLVDGHGFAHPRRFGLACHLGVLLDKPTIGCAKSRLCGEAGELDAPAGSTAGLWDGEERIGTLLRTKDRVKPVFVSIGHKVALDEAERWIRELCRGYRLPEPLRAAHRAANDALRQGVFSY